MIISHRHKFIFIKTKKVGGTSIEIALSKFCGPDDVVTPITPVDESKRRELGFASKQNYRKRLREYSLKDLVTLIFRGQVANKFYNHITAQKIKTVVSDTVWNTYTKVSVVRNPYDRAISRYFWTVRHQENPISFATYLTENSHVLGENRIITHIDGESAVDFWIKYENFDDGFKQLSQQLGLTEDINLTLRNITAKKGFRPNNSSVSNMFDGFDAGRALVADLCRGDIEEWGYALDQGDDR